VPTKKRNKRGAIGDGISDVKNGAVWEAPCLAYAVMICFDKLMQRARSQITQAGRGEVPERGAIERAAESRE
jgi:hypothetical protein